MLNADSVDFAQIFAYIVPAHFCNLLQEQIHIINYQYTVHFQHHFAEISMPKICIKTNNMLYVHSIWTSNSVSKSSQTLLYNLFP